MSKISLKGISKILSEKELKNVMGGSNGSGGNCAWQCTCDTPGSNGYYRVFLYSGTCDSGGPWDRNSSCPNSYQDCEPIN